MDAKKAVALLRLTRIEHSVMLVIAVIAAELMAGGLPALPILILSLVTPAFISMGAFAINDYFDVESDRANNRRERPLVSGAINRREAGYVALGCCAVGVLASASISLGIGNPIPFVIALLFAVLAFLYSYALKDMVLVGNGYIAFSMVIPFIYGDLVVSNSIPVSIVLISFVIFLGGLAREIHGMIRDYEGDAKARHSKNLVAKIGIKKSANFAFILYVEAIAISMFLFFYAAPDAYNPFAFNLTYLYPMTAVNIVLFYVGAMIALRPNNMRFLKLSRNLSLGAMAVGLLVYLVAQLYPAIVVAF